MASVCVDASVVVAWLIPTQQSADIDQRVAQYLRGEDDFIAPPLLFAEVTSTLRRWVFQHRLTEEEGQQMLRDFLFLGIREESPPGLYLRAFDLATAYNQPRAYEACYLALADLLSCEFLTLDHRLYNAVAGDYRWITLAGA